MSTGKIVPRKLLCHKLAASASASVRDRTPVSGSGMKRRYGFGTSHPTHTAISSHTLSQENVCSRRDAELLWPTSAKAAVTLLSVLAVFQAQPLPLAVRLSLMGSVFHLEDFRLNASHTQLRYLPLKMMVAGTAGNPKQAGGVTGGQTSGSPRGKHISTSVRLLVRTAFLPEQKTFNVFFSSVFAVRNRSSVPLLVSWHDASTCGLHLRCHRYNPKAARAAVAHGLP